MKDKTRIAYSNNNFAYQLKTSGIFCRKWIRKLPGRYYKKKACRAMENNDDFLNYLTVF